MASNAAHLKPGTPFCGIFPEDWVPIVNIVVRGRAVCEGDGGAQDVYMVALDKLSVDQFERVAKRCNERFPHVPFEECETEIRRLGLPLRVSQTDSVTTDCPFWV